MCTADVGTETLKTNSITLVPEPTGERGLGRLPCSLLPLSFPPFILAPPNFYLTPPSSFPYCHCSSPFSSFFLCSPSSPPITPFSFHLSLFLSLLTHFYPFPCPLLPPPPLLPLSAISLLALLEWLPQLYVFMLGTMKITPQCCPSFTPTTGLKRAEGNSTAERKCWGGRE